MAEDKQDLAATMYHGSIAPAISELNVVEEDTVGMELSRSFEEIHRSYKSRKSRLR